MRHEPVECPSRRASHDKGRGDNRSVPQRVEGRPDRWPAPGSAVRQRRTWRSTMSPTESGLSSVPRRVGNTASSALPRHSASEASSTAMLGCMSGVHRSLRPSRYSARGPPPRARLSRRSSAVTFDTRIPSAARYQRGVVAPTDPGCTVGGGEERVRLSGREERHHVPARPLGGLASTRCITAATPVADAR